MTDLQVKYHALQETKRANEKAEALKAMDAQSNARNAASREREASVSEREMARKEGREKYERSKLLVETSDHLINTVMDTAVDLTKIFSGVGNIAGSIVRGVTGLIA